MACTQTASVGELARDGAIRADAVDTTDTADTNTPAIDSSLPDVPGQDSADACAAACDQFAACLGAEFQAQCSASCTIDSAHVLTCEARRSGCTYPAECTTTPHQLACEVQCEALTSEECIVAFEARECIAACSDRSDARIMRFNACMSSTCTEDPCIPILFPYPPDNVEDCRRGCDTMHTFDCIDAPELTQCRAVCGRVNEDVAATFGSCTSGICSDDSCFTQLLLSDR